MPDQMGVATPLSGQRSAIGWASTCEDNEVVDAAEGAALAVVDLQQRPPAPVLLGSRQLWLLRPTSTRRQQRTQSRPHGIHDVGRHLHEAIGAESS
jgi:hypothetical protein